MHQKIGAELMNPKNSFFEKIKWITIQIDQVKKERRHKLPISEMKGGGIILYPTGSGRIIR